MAEVPPSPRGDRGRSGGTTTRVRWWSLPSIAFLILGGFEAWHDSATFDEPVYVSSGVVAILHHDLADNAEHPPLFKVLAALPVLAVGPVVPADGHWNTQQRADRTAPASCRRRCGPAPCTASRSPRASCRCSNAALLALALYASGHPALRRVGRCGGGVAVAVQSVGARAGPSQRGGSALRPDDGAGLVGPGALVATARPARRCSGSARPVGLRSRPRPPGCLSGRWLLGVVVVGRRAGRAAWLAAVAPTAAGRAGGLGRSCGPSTSSLDPGVVLHSWLILPQPYVEGSEVPGQ